MAKKKKATKKKATIKKKKAAAQTKKVAKKKTRARKSKPLSEKSEQKPTFKNEHVRILREALAKVANKAPAIWSLYARTQLSDFAQSVGNYCDCPERSYVQAEQKEACLFCGKRHEANAKLRLIK